MRVSRPAGFLAAATLAAAVGAGLGAFFLPGAARADVRAAVNWARMQGCSAPVARPALRDSSQLRLAAARLQSGASLQAALAAAGYRAARSSAVHISGALSDTQLAHTLAAGYCRTLVDPELSELGAERRARDVWMVLAAPLAVPHLENAAAVKRQVLSLVNAARASGRRCGGKYFAPAGPLLENTALDDAALVHSRDMAQHGEFDHRGHDGSTPAVRIKRAGYGAYRIVGENIAAGAMTPAEVTQGWLSSPAHCENIMDARFLEIGIGFAVNMSTAEAVYWTQDFAGPREAGPRR